MGEILSLSKVIENMKEKFPGLVHMRVPVCNSAAPLETDFDIITQTLLGSSITTPVIINDQVGLSRATTGCVVACLFKEFQITSSFDGLVETVPGMNLNLLKMDTYKMDMAKDTLFRGEFPVVVKLVEILKLYDKNADDTILEFELFKLLVNLGEKLTKEEAKNLMKELCDPADDDGFIPFKPFLEKMCAAEK